MEYRRIDGGWRRYRRSGMTVAIAALVLAACTGDDDAATSTVTAEPSTGSASETPQISADSPNDTIDTTLPPTSSAETIDTTLPSTSSAETVADTVPSTDVAETVADTVPSTDVGETSSGDDIEESAGEPASSADTAVTAAETEVGAVGDGDAFDCSLVPQAEVEALFGLPVEIPATNDLSTLPTEANCQYVYDDDEASRSFSFVVWPNESFTLESTLTEEYWASLERVDIGDGGVLDAATNPLIEWSQGGKLYQITVFGFGQIDGTPDEAQRKDLLVDLARIISANVGDA